MKLNKREKEIVYFVLSRVLDGEYRLPEEEVTNKEWEEIEVLREKFKA